MSLIDSLCRLVEDDGELVSPVHKSPAHVWLTFAYIVFIKTIVR